MMDDQMKPDIGMRKGGRLYGDMSIENQDRFPTMQELLDKQKAGKKELFQEGDSRRLDKLGMIMGSYLVVLSSRNDPKIREYEEIVDMIDRLNRATPEKHQVWEVTDARITALRTILLEMTEVPTFIHSTGRVTKAMDVLNNMLPPSMRLDEEEYRG